MNSTLVAIHVTFVGIWLGCVLTEALFERALLGQGRDKQKILGRLHRKVDLVVEIPAFVVVLITGLLLLRSAPGGPVLHTKVGFGLLAIVANIYCVYIVFARSKRADADDWEGFEKFDDAQHKVGAVVLLGTLVALGIGVYLA